MTSLSPEAPEAPEAPRSEGAGGDLGRRPCLSRKARLRKDRFTGRFLLLYPERALALSVTAAEIAALCDGRHTVREMILALEKRHDGPGTVHQDVLTFLGALEGRGLLSLGGR
jgi:pyrroloquinoline quinone biosynthesis protein D